MATELDSLLDSDGKAHADPLRQPDGTELLWRRKFAVAGMRCGTCAKRVEEALRGVPGVAAVTVDIGAAAADVHYDPSRVTLPALQAAVAAAGYALKENPATAAPPAGQPRVGWRVPWWPVFAGMLAGTLLTTLYIAIVGLAQGIDHAVELLLGDWYFVIPIVVGFGVQVGLFVYVRTRLRLRHGAGATKVLAGAGTGTSTVSMVACCAHHLTDVLPIIGISGAALFLNEYRGPLMVIGIVGNAIGIALMVRVIRKSGVLLEEVR